MPARAGSSLVQVPTIPSRRHRIERTAIHTYRLLPHETPADDGGRHLRREGDRVLATDDP